MWRDAKQGNEKLVAGCPGGARSETGMAKDTLGSKPERNRAKQNKNVATKTIEPFPDLSLPPSCSTNDTNARMKHCMPQATIQLAPVSAGYADC